MTAEYHPQADGLAERKNQTIEIAIRFYYAEHPGELWINIIPALQWNLNQAHHNAIGTSPHELLFGFKPRGPIDALTEEAAPEARSLRFLRESLRRDAEFALSFAEARAKRAYDVRHRNIEFKAGDWVWLKLHKGYHLPGKPHRKWSAQRSGPHKVLERVGRLAYRLDLGDMDVHPVISVAQLAPAGSSPPLDPNPGPVEADYSDLSDNDDPIYEVEQLLDRRQHRGRTQYLVKWKGWGHEENKWKYTSELQHCQDLIQAFERRAALAPVRRSAGARRKPCTDAPERGAVSVTAQEAISPPAERGTQRDGQPLQEPSRRSARPRKPRIPRD